MIGFIESPSDRHYKQTNKHAITKQIARMTWKSLNMLPHTLSKRTNLMFHQVIKTYIESCKLLFWHTESIVLVRVLKLGFSFLAFPSANHQLSDWISKKSISFFVFIQVDQHRMKQLNGYVVFCRIHQKLIGMEYMVYGY